MGSQQQIHVGPGGTFEASGDYITTPEDIDHLFADLTNGSEKAITIHVHGGLNSEPIGVEIAEMMKPVYEQANNFPIAFVWETGLLETVKQNLSSIHSTKLFQKLLKWVLRRTAERFGGFNAKGAGVPIPEAEIAAELQKTVPFADYDHADTGKGAAKGGGVAVSESDLSGLLDDLEAEFLEDIDVDDEIEDLLAEKDGEVPVDSSQKGIFTSAKTAARLAKVAFRVIRRHVRDRDHGYYPTVIEELLREFYLADFGAWVWTGMKTKAGDMWDKNDGVIGDEQHIGTYFLERLSALQQTKDIKVNLIGHSAGTIVICEMMSAIAKGHPNVKINEIVFLAPAVTCDLAVEQIAKHPDRFQRFRQFTMSDQFERDDVLVPYIYTRSLLYLISGVLEPSMVDMPIAGMMRHATGVAPFNNGPAKEWSDFISTPDRLVLADSSVLAPDAPNGEKSHARKHGDFDNDPVTQSSLVHNLRI